MSQFSKVGGKIAGVVSLFGIAASNAMAANLTAPTLDPSDFFVIAGAVVVLYGVLKAAKAGIALLKS
jgi:hypothetical protein